MTTDPNNLALSQSYCGIGKLLIGSGKGLDIVKVGFNQFTIKDITLVLNNILHAPLITTNLLHVHNLHKIVVYILSFILTLVMLRIR